MRIIGFDISSEYLERVMSRMTSEDYEGVDLIRGDIAAFPFKNGVFDLITCLSVLEHLNNPEKLLQKIKILLKEGGGRDY
jgi:ubiquinone/menaquinone biosynthesis C-methylase UbiE